MRYWWVNQNQTYMHEVPGGFLWSPKRSKGDRQNRFYDNMTLVASGDIIFSFCDTRIKALGVAIGPATSAERPEFGSIGEQWDREGWLIPVEFNEVDAPVRPKDFIEELRPHFLPKYNPIQPSGDGNQGVYLAEISRDFAEVLLAKMGCRIEDVLAPSPVANADDVVQAELEGRTDIGETQKQQLVMARRGQGIFKANLRLNETTCRVTGVEDMGLLIASHIKPWSQSTDREKLDGCNGLLLSPHIDRLFDRGLISFTDDGEILKSPHLTEGTWEAWGLAEITEVGHFSPKQSAYLAFHRAEIFKS
ncbi:MAG TPA: HNH endonuclease signature motif containing protein [Burkholderiales bacterium]|jgi:hypothetical protein|nr:HNH endonuclease signature motif containing protein [Burkholderiales bacterium]